MTTFVEALGKRLLVCDGAMGTMLHAAGNSLDRVLPELNLSKPDSVRTIHDSYVAARVDLILTNTFGAGRLRLAEQGYAGDVAEINYAGVRLARQAADAAGRAVFVGGSIAPAVSASQRPRTPAGERIDAVTEQVAALAEAGVDLLVFETFGYLEELVEAVQVAAETTDLPIVAQATFTDDGNTPGGDSPRDVAKALSGLRVVALGANCTVGPQRMHDIVKELRRSTTLPISAQPNAGLPRRIAGRRFEYPLDHDYFVRYARQCIAAGAAIVGGCCGTTPTHIRALTAAVAGSAGRVAAKAAGPPVPDNVARPLGERGFVVAAEVTPPTEAADRPAEFTTMLPTDGTDLVLVSPAPGARARLSSASLALQLQEQLGVETIATFTTWDKTRMSLQADVLGAHACGTRTVVCETGSPALQGDYPDADGVWELDSIDLIDMLAGLNGGRDCNGLSLSTTTSFQIGARCNPGADDLGAEISRTRAKIAAGAQFLVTRPVYELDGLRRIVGGLGPQRVPVLVTVCALSGFAEAEYLAYEVPDVTIPPETLAELAAAGTSDRETGARIAAYLVSYVVNHARSLADGVVVVVGDDPEATQLLLAAASD
jgi:methionine synthase I (cobalamin-dependent)/5,10-methylenetetrahydrofolate reductase